MAKRTKARFEDKVRTSDLSGAHLTGEAVIVCLESKFDSIDITHFTIEVEDQKRNRIGTIQLDGPTGSGVFPISHFKWISVEGE